MAFFLKQRALLAALAAFFFAPQTLAQTTPPDLTLVPVTTSVSMPVAIRAPRDRSNRIFIVQLDGAIRIVQNGTLLPTPFLDIPGVDNQGSGGLLGMAFHPNYGIVGQPHNNEFYVAYTRPDADPRVGSSPDQVVARYTVSANPNIANPDGTLVMRVPDLDRHHNGGDIHFGPDGHLYWSMGDGGPQNDVHGFAQCLWKKAADSTPANCGTGTPTYFLLGKMIRIDVDNRGGAVTADMCGSTGISPAEYSIPASNPHVGTSNTCDEIYLHGFGNPWRFSFDRVTGDLWIGDVGQNSREEIDMRLAGSVEPTFYGWRCYEGTSVFSTSDVCSSAPPHVLPVMEYTHFTENRCAITGGFRFRGPIQALQGTYLFADACSSEIFFGRPSGPSSWASTVWRNDINNLGAYSGFGEDEHGNVYVAHTADGDVFRVHSDYIFTHGLE